MHIFDPMCANVVGRSGTVDQQHSRDVLSFVKAARVMYAHDSPSSLEGVTAAVFTPSCGISARIAASSAPFFLPSHPARVHVATHAHPILLLRLPPPSPLRVVHPSPPRRRTSAAVSHTPVSNQEIQIIAGGVTALPAYPVH